MTSEYDTLLTAIDARLSETLPSQIPQLLDALPLGVWGKLLLDVPPRYANLKAFFPSMPSDIIQTNWTGNHGTSLLSQTVAFVESLVRGYRELTGRSLETPECLISVAAGAGSFACYTSMSDTRTSSR